MIDDYFEQFKLTLEEYDPNMKWSEFGNPILVDAGSKEVEIPKCKICGESMCQLIGKEAFMWLCMYCKGEKGDA